MKYNQLLPILLLGFAGYVTAGSAETKYAAVQVSASGQQTSVNSFSDTGFYVMDQYAQDGKQESVLVSPDGTKRTIGLDAFGADQTAEMRIFGVTNVGDLFAQVMTRNSTGEAQHIARLRFGATSAEILFSKTVGPHSQLDAQVSPRGSVLLLESDGWGTRRLALSFSVLENGGMKSYLTAKVNGRRKWGTSGPLFFDDTGNFSFIADRSYERAQGESQIYSCRGNLLANSARCRKTQKEYSQSKIPESISFGRYLYVKRGSYVVDGALLGEGLKRVALPRGASASGPFYINSLKRVTGGFSMLNSKNPTLFVQQLDGGAIEVLSCNGAGSLNTSTSSGYLIAFDTGKILMISSDVSRSPGLPIGQEVYELTPASSENGSAQCSLRGI